MKTRRGSARVNSCPSNRAPSYAFCGGPHFSQPAREKRGIRAGGTPALLWLRDDAQVRLGRLPAIGILLLRFFVRHRGQNDDFAALLPICRGGYFVLSRELNRIEDAQYLVEISAGAHGIAELKFDLLVRTNNEYRAHSGIVRRGAALGRISALGR